MCALMVAVSGDDDDLVVVTNNAYIHDLIYCLSDITECFVVYAIDKKILSKKNNFIQEKKNSIGTEIP